MYFNKYIDGVTLLPSLLTPTGTFLATAKTGRRTYPEKLNKYKDLAWNHTDTQK